MNPTKFVLSNTAFMKSLISWGELLIILPVFLVSYYLIILILFYRKDILIKNIPGRNNKQQDKPEDKQFTKNTDSDDGILYNQVLELMEDCKEVFKSAIANALESSQVTEAIAIKLQKYPQIRGTSFQIAITNHIEQELLHRCNISLTAEERDRLWKW